MCGRSAVCVCFLWRDDCMEEWLGGLICNLTSHHTKLSCFRHSFYHHNVFVCCLFSFVILWQFSSPVSPLYSSVESLLLFNWLFGTEVACTVSLFAQEHCHPISDQDTPPHHCQQYLYPTINHESYNPCLGFLRGWFRLFALYYFECVHCPSITSDCKIERRTTIK